MKTITFGIVFMLCCSSICAQTARDLGITIGVMKPGTLNAITDVQGIRIGHTTVISGTDVRTGVTAIHPHDGNVFQQKVPAAIFIGNGFGKLMGYSQVEELGNLETPVVLTNTLSVPTAANAVIKYTLSLVGNEEVRSVNAVIGETNDGRLNDIRGMHISEEQVLSALRNAKSGPVEQGNVGAGTGTVCFGFKGGIGTSSRVLPENHGGYTVGVLVQSNFGGVLTIDGIPVGEQLGQYYLHEELSSEDGSCMIVVATDAPIDARNLKRLAKRAFLGLGRTGGIASNGSGDYVIAFSTHADLRIQYQSPREPSTNVLLPNGALSPLFMATIEATEEAIINSLIAAKTMTGFDGITVNELPESKLSDLVKALEK